MPSMLSYPHRPKSGQITCYLNRTYHVLTTCKILHLDSERRPWDVLSSGLSRLERNSSARVHGGAPALRRELTRAKEEISRWIDGRIDDLCRHPIHKHDARARPAGDGPVHLQRPLRGPAVCRDRKSTRL